MNEQQIKYLLEKYFEGETTLQEEAQLHAYFAQTELHPSLVAYQPMFQFFREEQQKELNEAFDTRLLQAIHGASQPRLRVRRMYYRIGSAAAVVLMTLGGWWAYHQATRPKTLVQTIDWSKYEPATPEEAYQILKTSLKKASQELNEGAGMATEEISKVRKVTEMIQ